MSTLEKPGAKNGANGNGHELKVVEDATCTFCGCVCDDIELTVEVTRSSRPSGPACWARRGSSITTIEDRPAA